MSRGVQERVSKATAAKIAVPYILGPFTHPERLDLTPHTAGFSQRSPADQKNLRVKWAEADAKHGKAGSGVAAKPCSPPFPMHHDGAAVHVLTLMAA